MTDSTDNKPEEVGIVASSGFGKKKKKKRTIAKEDTKELADHREKESEEIQQQQSQEGAPQKQAEEEEKENVSRSQSSNELSKNSSEDAAEQTTNKENLANGGSNEVTSNFLPLGQTTGDYTYEQLAGRIFSLITSSRPEEKTVYKMKPPVVYRDGNTKTIWANFPEICKIMNRSPEHVLSFVLAEAGSTGSIDGSGRLVIKGKFQPKHIENILRKYIAEYVKCHTCSRPETYLKKENRLLFTVCEKCGSVRSVMTIKSGFQATTRASRRAAKEQ